MCPHGRPQQLGYRPVERVHPGADRWADAVRSAAGHGSVARAVPENLAGEDEEIR